MPNSIIWIVDRLENSHAVLVWQKQTISVPKRFLPLGVKEGDALSQELYFQRDEKKRRENLARAILEEMLTPSE